MADEPAFLTVGTEVSAKFKGAFCEAKIKKVQKCVKCKVAFTNSPNSVIVISDEVIQGNNLLVGSTIKAQNPDNLHYSDAKIIKIMDSSLYTVEFDDGDIRTLRRNLICLKGQKHFQESQTLDKLPLTNPESFGTPVVTKKSSSSSKNVANSSSEQRGLTGQHKNTQSSHTKSSGHSRSLYSNVQDPTFNHKGNPNKMKSSGLTSSNKSASSGDKCSKKIHPKNTQTESSSKSKIIKKDKDTKSNEVKDQVFPSDSEDEHRLSSLKGGNDEGNNTSGLSEDEEEEEETQEEKDHFVARLYKFMDDRGTPLNKLPSIGSTDLNLHKLFKTVTNMGYYNKVTNNDKWMEVCRAIGVFKLCDWPRSMVVKRVQASYKKYLLSFEDFSRKLGCLMFSTPEPRSTPTHPGGGGGSEGGNSTPSTCSGAGEGSSTPNYVPVGRSLIREKRYSSSSTKNAPNPFSPTSSSTSQVSHRRRSMGDKGTKNGGGGSEVGGRKQQEVAIGVVLTNALNTHTTPPGKASPQKSRRPTTSALHLDISQSKPKVDTKCQSVKETTSTPSKIILTQTPPVVCLKSFDEALSSPDLIQRPDPKEHKEKKNQSKDHSRNNNPEGERGRSSSESVATHFRASGKCDIVENVFDANAIAIERLREKAVKLVTEYSPDKFEDRPGGGGDDNDKSPPTSIKSIKPKEDEMLGDSVAPIHTFDDTVEPSLINTTPEAKDLNADKEVKSEREDPQSLLPDKLNSGATNRTSRRLEAKKRKALVEEKGPTFGLGGIMEQGLKKKHPSPLPDHEDDDDDDTIKLSGKIKSSLKGDPSVEGTLFDRDDVAVSKLVQEIQSEIKSEEESAFDPETPASQSEVPDFTNGKVEFTRDQISTAEKHDISSCVLKTGSSSTIETFVLKPPTLTLTPITSKEPFKTVCPSQTPSPPILSYPAKPESNLHMAAENEFGEDHQHSNNLTPERDEDESDDGLKVISRSTWGPSSAAPLMESVKASPPSESTEVIASQPQMASSWWRSHTEKQLVERMEEQVKPLMHDNQHVDLVKRKVTTFAEIQNNFVCPYDFTSIDEDLPCEGRIAVTKSNINSLKKHYQRHKTRVAEIDKILKNIQKLEESGATAAEIKEYYTNVKDNINSDVSSDSSIEN